MPPLVNALASDGLRGQESLRAPGVSAADADTLSLDERYMRAALDAAEAGSKCGEVPIGAVVVRDSVILGAAHNAPIRLKDPTAHAEILALRQAAIRSGNYRLTGASIYVTAEPCLMCVGALLQARVQRIVFACTEPKTGAIQSLARSPVEWLREARISIHSGVLASESVSLLQEFFRARRGA